MPTAPRNSTNTNQLLTQYMSLKHIFSLCLKSLLVCLVCFAGQVLAQELPYSSINTDKKMASSVAFSVDGRLATASVDGKIYFWNVDTKSVDNLLEEHTDMILKVCFSADGQMLASGGKDKKVLVWNVAGGVVKFNFTGHEATVTSLSFSADGKYLASGSADKTVKIWDLSTGSLHKTLTYHKKEVSTVAFSKQGLLLASGSYDGTVKIYNLQTDQIEKQFNPNSGRVRSVTFSPDDRLIATGTDDENVKIWDVTIGALKKTFDGHANDVYDLEFSSDGKYLASGCLGNEVRIWSLEMAENSHTLQGFYKFLGLSFSADGKYLAVADLDLKTKLYDLSTLHIKPTQKYLSLKSAKKYQSGITLQGPVFTDLSPKTTPKEPVKTEERTMLVKGNIQAPAGLFILLVNGIETKPDSNGNFSKEVRLAYYDNQIIVKAIDNEKRTQEDTVHIYRIFNKNAPDEVAGNKRHGSDYAFLIGSDEYTAMHHLSNPVNDINTIANDLETIYDFKVQKVLNAELGQIYSEIRKYSQMTFEEDDQLFIMFAGHGIYDGVFKEGYLVAKDSKKEDDGKQTYLSYSNLRTLLNNIPCKHIFLVLDACFGGTFDQSVAHRGGEDDKIYAAVNKDEFVLRKLKYKTRLYLTSGGKEYVPDGRPGQHSPFARRILEALRSGGGEDHILTSGELLTYIDKVSPEPQKGQFGDNQPGSDFLFIKK